MSSNGGRLLKETTHAMANYVRSIVPILGIDPPYGELAGTGAIFNWHDVAYLLTAAHVADQGKHRYQGLAVSTHPGRSAERIRSVVHCISRPVDLALAKISGPQVGDVVKSLDTALLKELTIGIGAERDILFLMGFPGVRSRFSALGGGVFSTAIPLGTTGGESSFSWFDPSQHIAIRYPADGGSDERSRLVPFPDPHGFSGTLLWNTNRMKFRDGWSPEQARVLGIITTWDREAQSLIATRAEVIRNFVLESLRMERAYELLQRDGGDQLATWRTACEQIPNPRQFGMGGADSDHDPQCLVQPAAGGQHIGSSAHCSSW